MMCDSFEHRAPCSLEYLIAYEISESFRVNRLTLSCAWHAQHAPHALLQLIDHLVGQHSSLLVNLNA